MLIFTIITPWGLWVTAVSLGASAERKD